MSCTRDLLRFCIGTFASRYTRDLVVMTLRLGSNISSLIVQRRLGEANTDASTSLERLSSGLRINRASDDSAGLAIALGLNAERRVYNQAIRNINDGLSFLTIAESALNALSTISARQIELAQQAANGTFSFVQRQALHDEANALVDEFNRILASTAVNGRTLLDGTISDLNIQVGSGSYSSLSLSLAEELSRTVGTGSFAAIVTHAIAGTGGVHMVKAADVNGDGIEDIIATYNTNSDLNVFLGTGGGNFSAPLSFDTLGTPVDFSIADVNNDGILDVLVASSASGAIETFIGNGNGTFKASVTYQNEVNVGSLAVADFNNDGITDLISVTSAGNIRLMLGNSNGSFQASTIIETVTGSGQEVNVGDFNHDGNIDFATSMNGSTLVYMGLGNGTFGPKLTLGTGTIRSADVGDFNNDGYDDVAFTSYAGDAVYVSISNGDGTFSTTVYTTNVTQPRYMEEADINNDGYLDLVIQDSALTSLTFLLGNGDGTFSLAASDTNPAVTIKSVSDVNGDGVQDILSNSSNAIGIRYGITTSSPYTPHVTLHSEEDALQALDTFTAALERVSLELGSIGAHQTRLSVALSNALSISSNLEAAESRIMDADIATETALLVRANILKEVAVAILAQANQEPSLVLKLLDDSLPS